MAGWVYCALGGSHIRYEGDNDDETKKSLGSKDLNIA